MNKYRGTTWLQRVISFGGGHFSAFQCRRRALGWKLLGAQLGERAAIGPDCSSVNLCRLSAGERFTLEGKNRIKVVTPDGFLRFGDRVFLGTGAIVDASSSILVEDDVLIGPGVFITDHNHGTSVAQRINQQPCTARNVLIESDVWIGANACVLAGSQLHTGCVVAAGAVVTGTVASNTIVGGVPARKIGERK